MNNDELDKLLHSAKVPEMPYEYWSDFPKKITTKLHWQDASSALNRQGRSEGSDGMFRARTYRLRFAWIGGVTAVCVAVGLMFKSQTPRHAEMAKTGDSSELAQARKCYSELEALFPHQLREIAFDEHGPRMTLADQPVVPDSTPFYLKICGPNGCEGFVTFSGQRIQVGGESCEVLADAQGRVMLVGNEHVWQQNSTGNSIRVQATPLSAVL